MSFTPSEERRVARVESDVESIYDLISAVHRTQAAHTDQLTAVQSTLGDHTNQLTEMGGTLREILRRLPDAG